MSGKRNLRLQILDCRLLPDVMMGKLLFLQSEICNLKSAIFDVWSLLNLANHVDSIDFQAG
jgi:hypothetical protein